MLILKFGLNRELKEQTERSVSHIAFRIVKWNRSSLPVRSFSAWPSPKVQNLNKKYQKEVVLRTS